MSLTVSQGEDETLFTVTLNPKSKWHIWLQIRALWDYIVWTVSPYIKEIEANIQTTFGIVLFAVINLTLVGFGVAIFEFVLLCLAKVPFSIFQFISVLQSCVVLCFWVLTVKSLRKKSVGVKDMKETFTDTHTALGIIVGVVNIALACFGLTGLHFWFSSVSLLVGIMCVLAIKYPSSGLLIVAVILNSDALAITAVVLHRTMRESYSMLSQEDISNINTCEYYNNLNKVFFEGVHIIMTVLSSLQFCATVSFCVLTLKVMCKTDGCTKSEEKPLAVIHAGEIGIVV